MTEPDEVHAHRGPHPDPLGEPPAGPARRAAAAAQPGHDGARRTRRPHADLPDGDHRPGGLDATRRSRSRSRCATSTSSGARRRSSARTGSSASSIRPRTSTTSTRASPRPARTSRTARSRRRTRTRRPASSGSSTETGAGQWGSALALACSLFGLECVVYMVGASYDQKPYRRAMMESWGATVIRSPSDTTEAGREPGRAPDRLARHRDLRGGRGGRAATTTRTTRSARCSTTSACTRP